MEFSERRTILFLALRWARMRFEGHSSAQLFRIGYDAHPALPT